MGGRAGASAPWTSAAVWLRSLLVCRCLGDSSSTPPAFVAAPLCSKSSFAFLSCSLFLLSATAFGATLDAEAGGGVCVGALWWCRLSLVCKVVCGVGLSQAAP